MASAKLLLSMLFRCIAFPRLASPLLHSQIYAIAMQGVSVLCLRFGLQSASLPYLSRSMLVASLPLRDYSLLILGTAFQIHCCVRLCFSSALLSRHSFAFALQDGSSQFRGISVQPHAIANQCAPPPRRRRSTQFFTFAKPDPAVAVIRFAIALMNNAMPQLN